MSKHARLAAGHNNIPRSSRSRNYVAMTMLFAAALIAVGLSYWGVSAANEGEGEKMAVQDAANEGDFVVAFMDSPSGSILRFNIRAGGFSADSSKRFPEIGVSGTADDGPQLTPDIAAAGNGDFVIVWADDADGNKFYQIHARGFHSDGSQLFPTMTVNTEAKGMQTAPVIAMTPNGDFVVTWQDDMDGNDVYQIHARGFNSDGSQRFPTMTVNSDAAGDQSAPAIAMALNGDFVVTWQNDRSLDGLYNIFARGFNSDGSPRFSTKTVNTTLTGDQLYPDIAMAPNGEFVITWQDDTDLNGANQIHARGFTRSGQQRIAPFTVNSVASGDQTTPYIAMADNGDFVVTWTDDQDKNGVDQVMARGFKNDGSPKFPDFFVNSVANGNQFVTDIAMSGNGDFVIPWQDDQDGNNVYQILARGFNSDGSERFPDFTVNEKAAGQQWIPAVAVVRKGPTVYLPFVK